MKKFNFLEFNIISCRRLQSEYELWTQMTYQLSLQSICHDIPTIIYSPLSLPTDYLRHGHPNIITRKVASYKLNLRCICHDGSHTPQEPTKKKQKKKGRPLHSRTCTSHWLHGNSITKIGCHYFVACTNIALPKNMKPIQNMTTPHITHWLQTNLTTHILLTAV